MSLPLTMVTPASRASFNIARFDFRACGSGWVAGGCQPRYLLIASLAASVGQSATPRSTISLNTSPGPSPWSIVLTPASTARGWLRRVRVRHRDAGLRAVSTIA